MGTCVGDPDTWVGGIRGAAVRHGERVSEYEPKGKLPGKTQYSSRRRSAVREAGFHAHPDATGGEVEIHLATAYQLSAGDSLTVDFEITGNVEGKWVGYGGWYHAPKSAMVSIEGEGIFSKRTLSTPAAPDWSKFGSMWVSDGTPARAVVTFRSSETCKVALWHLGCGIIEHERLSGARKELLGNMYRFSPEGHFYTVRGVATVKGAAWPENGAVPIVLKSCNRCARFLPINLNDEQKHLSFSNHCKAAHRRPCSHAGFGKLRVVATGKEVRLDYGFQLECRFCKKFEVNAAHNPQRTPAQMKEDAARRRFFEVLLTELYGGSSQLAYRHRTDGRELAGDVWERFGHECFNCETPLANPRVMRLDHTRPLAMLWPLDDHATALCEACNSAKRDRPPIEFYSTEQLSKLAEIVDLPLGELCDPHPNLDAVRRLHERLDWFFDDFLCRPDLTKERDGKTVAELLLKALSKVLSQCPAQYRFDIVAEFEQRRSR